MANENGKWPLPEGWVWTTLGDVCDINMGQSPPSNTYNTDGVGLPFYQGKAEFGALYPTPVKWCSRPQKISEAGDILLSVRAPVGSTNLNRETSCIGRGLAAIKPPVQMNNLYFLYYLRFSEQDLIDQATGTTFQAVSGSTVRNHLVPLAPTLEQHRIVAEIEKQFTRLDAAVAALKRAKANLARYKAAVLKAAVEGRLVAQDPDDEPAAALLERILAERRAQWEAANPKKPYVEPKRPEVAGLPELPVGWVWATVEQVAAHEPQSITDGPFGSKLKTEHYTEAGPRVIRLQNIGDGEFVNAMAHISKTHYEFLKRHSVFAGDLVIAGLGTNLPRACIVPDYVGSAIVKADCIRFKPHPALADSHYLNAALNSEPLKQYATMIIHGVGRPRLNQDEIRSLVIPLPPISEQRKIVDEVESCLSVIQASEQVIAANLARAERLRQGVLGKAFRGELVASGETSEVSEDL